MSEAILVLNLGSSSLKSSVYFLRGSGLELDARAQFDALPTTPSFVARNATGRVLAQRQWGSPLSHEAALAELFVWLRDELARHRLVGVGHRVVHGGPQFAAPRKVDASLLAALEALIPLAPLHQPASVAMIRRLAAMAPELPQVACFDTAFHQTQPQLAQLFALPLEYWDAGIRRYGFHGLSYEFIAQALPAIDPRAAAGRTVVLHLGAGASGCALAGGKSVATTMGLTALDGLMMATRCGSLDPGVVLYLMQNRGMDAAAIERLLYSGAGLLGVSGIAGDLRRLLASDAPAAALAVDLFCYRIGRELGSLAAVLGGIDALVFTAGIGEHSAEIRRRVCRDAAWLGVELDHAANQAGAPRLSRPGARAAAWLIPTDEELMIARHTRRVLERQERPGHPR
ncbi:MAG: acetate/propionate family kinase [Burkholderiaceae bacterium]